MHELSAAFLALCELFKPQSHAAADGRLMSSVCLQTLGFEPIAPGATATAELATLQNQALHNPAAAAGTLQVHAWHLPLC